VAERLPSAAGRLLADEINAFERLLHDPDRPYVVLLGGAKVSDKLGVIRALLPKVDVMLVGGAMCFTLLAAEGSGAHADDAGALILSVRAFACLLSLLLAAQFVALFIRHRARETVLLAATLLANAFSELVPAFLSSSLPFAAAARMANTAFSAPLSTPASSTASTGGGAMSSTSFTRASASIICAMGGDDASSAKRFAFARRGAHSGWGV
jgi:hypothetical protein